MIVFGELVVILKKKFKIDVYLFLDNDWIMIFFNFVFWL